MSSFLKTEAFSKVCMKAWGTCHGFHVEGESSLFRMTLSTLIFHEARNVINSVCGSISAFHWTLGNSTVEKLSYKYHLFCRFETRFPKCVWMHQEMAIHIALREEPAEKHLPTRRLRSDGRWGRGRVWINPPRLWRSMHGQVQGRIQ